jgi:hypothetical protein
VLFWVVQVLCAVPRPKPDIVPFASGKWIKCGINYGELSALIKPNTTGPQANSTAWQPIKLYFNPEEAPLDTSKTYALVLQNCPIGECWLSANKESDDDDDGVDKVADSDYEVGTRATKPGDGSHSTMVFKSGSWHAVPTSTSVVLAFHTAGSTEHGYRPNQLHNDWVSFHW